MAPAWMLREASALGMNGVSYCIMILDMDAQITD